MQTMADIKLKPCPFCGATPKLYWESWDEISATSGCYVLEAKHKNECFIALMNGFNFSGRMSSFNEKHLIDAWNRRVNNG